ncbi:Ubiquinone/menaquinone biosynthesis C-methylase UbiE [Daejeonella rubra]|uniref:Ubiquinone/menaquinone biosynthesis C-methylase UbiE n=1 Tax=Daejeonella rubra TaxID=990371 RepID=A0A1G9WJY8_9SPHI|nr:class I SAM-dependent methyltransferase [Daejeonella rubra]SDM84573.1 Ubiquinone/menaquinone biosynthesis C-methylase UbiE [Daejeonella rubra]
MAEEIVSADVKNAYDEFYLGRDEQWRMLGARYKAKNIIDVTRGHDFKKVLEVGAGDGSILRHLSAWSTFPEMHALEISQSGVDQIKALGLKNLSSVNIFDGYHIPFKDNEIDLVILSHVLEHVEFERMLLREIKRVSKYLIIEVPCDYRYGVDKRMKHFLNYGHINMYTPSSLRFLVQSEGFEVLSDKISMIEPEVTKFNTFVNQKKAKSLLTILRIDLEFLVKKFIIRISGKKRHESFANAYTALLRNQGDLDIF